MKKNFLYLSFLLFTLFACRDRDKFLTTKAAKLVDDKCNCFKTAGVSLSDKAINVFEKALTYNDTSFYNLYDSLPYEEKMELENFMTLMYGSASKLSDCLFKANKKDIEELGNIDMNHIDAFIIQEAQKRPDCKVVLYDESGTIRRIMYLQMATAIVNNECNCFKSKGISLSNKVIRFLEKAKNSAYVPSTLNMYDDSLTYEEKMELKNFITLVTDSTSSLRNCLHEIKEKATKGMDNPYPEIWPDELERPVLHEVSKRTDCGLLRYYELVEISRIEEMQKIVETADKECNCFQSAKISLGSNLLNVLNGAINESDSSYVQLYKSLTNEEREELKKFITNVYDSTSEPGGCLSQVNKGRHYYTVDTYSYETSTVAYRRPHCSLVFYYESGALKRLKQLQTTQTR